MALLGQLVPEKVERVFTRDKTLLMSAADTFQ